MKASSISNRRKFYSDWDQLMYLYYKILYWYYHRGNRRMAVRFCARFEALLNRVASNHEAIKGEECWSLLYEIKGDLDRAVHHKQIEIRLIKRFQQLNKRLTRSLPDYGPQELVEALILLALLYREKDSPREAIKALNEAKRVAAKAGVPFDGCTLLAELQRE